MKNIKYNKSVADKISVKGIVAEDGVNIVYEDDEGNSVMFDVKNSLKPFIGEEVTLSVATKKDQDCTEDLTAEGYDD